MLKTRKIVTETHQKCRVTESECKDSGEIASDSRGIMDVLRGYH